MTSLQLNVQVNTGYYKFTAPGNYLLYCEEDPAINASISVVNESTHVPNLSNNDNNNNRYKALLFVHVAAMMTGFGVLLPIGAFAAHHEKLVLHKITQPLGVFLAVVGVSAIVVYNQLSGAGHFRRGGGVVHGGVGLVLVGVACVVMPLLLLRRSWRAWHRRCGHLVVFFGMGNTLLGLAILSVGPVPLLVLRVLFSLWLLLLVVPLYIFLSPPSQKSSFTGKVSGLRRTSSGPQVLKIAVIGADKMIALRRMSSVDNSLDMTMLEAQGEGFGNGGPPRRVDSRDGRESVDWAGDAASDSTSCVSCGGEGEGAELDNTNVHALTLQQASLASHHHHQESSGHPRTAFAHPHGFSDVPDNASMTSAHSTRITRHSRRAWMHLDLQSTSLPTHATPQVELEISHASPKHLPTQLSLQQKLTGHLLPPLSAQFPLTQSTAHNTHSHARQPSPPITCTPDDLSTRGVSPCSIGDDSVFTSSPSPQKRFNLLPTDAPLISSARGVSPEGMHNTANVGDSLCRDLLLDNVLQSLGQGVYARQLSEAVVCTNSQQEVVLWSSGAVSMFGYRATEAEGSSLELIIPQRHKARHRQMVAQKNLEFAKYLRKHSYAPPDQKTTRTYSSHGVAKNGKEFPVEVRVSSFMVDREVYYVGVITELAQRCKALDMTASAGSDVFKHKALIMGAQMKVAHKLVSTETMSHGELSRLLEGGLAASGLKATTRQVEEMVNAIMKAGGVEEGGDTIPFTAIVELLPKYNLVLNESGIIARGNQGSVAPGNLSRGPRREPFSLCQRTLSSVRHCLRSYWPRALWTAVYLMLNVGLFVVGVTTTKMSGWRRWGYGMGPVLSMNCVLVLLPTLKSLVHNMRSSSWMSRVFPLTRPMLAHGLIACVLVLWALLHVTTHLASYALDNIVDDGNSSSSSHTFSDSPVDHIRESLSLTRHLYPSITGGLLLLLIAVFPLSSVGKFRRISRFIPFFLTHWTATALFYGLLLTHGNNFVNPSFWKWLLPAVIIAIVELAYRYSVATWFGVRLAGARQYGDSSTVCMVELDRPRGFQFIPGQYILLNVPWIGKFHWQLCYISGGLNEKLLVYLPSTNDPWLTLATSHLSSHPYPAPPPAEVQSSCQHVLKDPSESGSCTLTSTVSRLSDVADKSVPVFFPPAVNIAGPYGVGLQVVLDYPVSVIVCTGTGPHPTRALLEKYFKCKKMSQCSCHPPLKRIYLVWVIPSGKDFEWFTDYLAEFVEDDHWKNHVVVKVFLTDIPHPPDDLSSVLLQLGLRVSPSSLRRPSQPQLNHLYNMTSYGAPDFNALLDTVSEHHSKSLNGSETGVNGVGNNQSGTETYEHGMGTEVGVFTVGRLHYSTAQDLREACQSHSNSTRLIFRQYHFKTS